jgi:hypothetical protein
MKNEEPREREEGVFRPPSHQDPLFAHDISGKATEEESEERKGEASLIDHSLLQEGAQVGRSCFATLISFLTYVTSLSAGPYADQSSFVWFTACSCQRN